ncbi:MAG: urease accessory protein UreD [Chloroflexi bacterium]|nr:urease accessory protein UreD [Chloroflexota bacterium]
MTPDFAHRLAHSARSQGMLELHVGLVRLAGGHRAPMHLGRLLYPDASAPDMAYAFVTTIGGGLLDGDTLSTSIVAARGSRLHVTTTGATRIYGMDHGIAIQSTSIRADEDAYVEVVPDMVIPFRGSAFQNDTYVTVAESATVVVSEIIMPGRTASGEWHEYRSFSTRLTARRPDGHVLAVDAFVPAPSPVGARPFASTSHQVWASSERRQTTRHQIGSLDGASTASDRRAGPPWAVTALPNDAGIAVRLIACDGHSARSALTSIWRAFRRAMTGAEPGRLRKN